MMNETINFLSQHGSLVLAAAVFAEQIGLPLPALPFLIAAGALVGTGQMGLGMAVVSAVLAAMAGDQIWFELGRRRGRLVLNWLCRISLEPTSCVRRTEDFFARHGVRSLIVAKFVPGFSTIAPPLAGIVGLSVPQYLLFNGLGTLLWVGTGIALGMAFSDQLEQALAMTAQIGPTVGLAVFTAVIGYVVYKAVNRYRADYRVPRVTVRQLTDKLAAGETPVIVDLRSLAVRQEEPGIPGALPLTLEELVTRHHELPRDRDVILYCACPKDASSVEGTKRLRKLGFTRVWPLAGGLGAWNAAATAFFDGRAGVRSLRCSGMNEPAPLRKLASEERYQMELKMPTAEQARWGLRAMKTVALADGALNDAERQMLTSVQTILGTNYAVEDLAPITPEELASGLPDRQIRYQLVQGLIVVSLIDGKANVRETEMVEQFARALEVDAPEVRDLRYLLNGEMLRLRLDLARRFWLREKVKEIWNNEGVRGLLKFVRGMVGRYEDSRPHPSLPSSGALSYRIVGSVLLGILSDERLSLTWRKGGCGRSKSCFTIARMSYPAMGRHPMKKCKWPALVRAFNGATLGRSCSSCCCNSMLASA